MRFRTLQECQVFEVRVNVDIKSSDQTHYVLHPQRTPERKRWIDGYIEVWGSRERLGLETLIWK